MKQLTSFLKKLQLSKILTVLLAGIVLFVTTACNSGDVRSSRPEAPKSSMETKIQDQNRRDQQSSLPSSQLVAGSYDSGLLYQGSESPSGRIAKERTFPKITDEGASEQIPAERQPVLNRTNPDARILERSAETFNKASEFIGDKADEASARPEMKRNPAIEK